MNTEFISALKAIEKERNIPLEMLVRALEDALAAAYKRNFGPNQNIIVEIERHHRRNESVRRARPWWRKYRTPGSKSHWKRRAPTSTTRRKKATRCCSR